MNNDLTFEEMDESPYSDLDIRHIRLSSGAEIIAMIGSLSDHLAPNTEMTEEDETLLCLENPLQVHASITQKGQSFFFTRWLPLSKHDVCLISVMHIVTIVECSDSIKEKYVDATLAYREEMGDVESESIEPQLRDMEKSFTIH